jgi:hypothetical protein
MDRKLIRLTEADLHRIVKESVNRILKEGYVDDTIETYGNPPYTASFKYEGDWTPCNNPNDLEDYMIDVENHYNSTMGECGRATIYNSDGEDIWSLG